MKERARILQNLRNKKNRSLNTSLNSSGIDSKGMRSSSKKPQILRKSGKTHLLSRERSESETFFLKERNGTRVKYTPSIRTQKNRKNERSRYYKSMIDTFELSPEGNPVRKQVVTS